jgi:hypothetical protein
MLPWNRVLTSSTSIFQTSCERVLVALTVCACRAVEFVLGSDGSDRLASPSENKNEKFPLQSSSLHCNTSATALCCLKTKHIVKSLRVLSGNQS